MKHRLSCGRFVLVAVVVLTSGVPLQAQRAGNSDQASKQSNTLPLTKEIDRHLAILLDGVQHVDYFDTVGDLSVFGPDAIPVVAAPANSKEGRAPIIAAAKLGKGRLVALAHDEFLGFQGGGGGPDRKLRQRLLSNLIRWSAGAEANWAKPLRTLRVAVRGRWGVTGWLREQRVGVEQLPEDDWNSSLENTDVVITGVFDNLSDAQLDALSRFVRDGGGVIAACPGWAWQGYRAKPGQTLPEDHTGNRLFAPAGIVWGGGTVKTPQFNQLLVESPKPELNALLALESLIARREQAGTGTSQPTIVPAGDGEPNSEVLVATIARAINEIPQSDQLLRPRVNEYLEARRGQLGLPSHERPLKPSDSDAWLAVSFQAAQLRTLPPEKITAHPAASLFPGAVPVSAPRIHSTVEIETAVPDWQSTGLYAAPGDLVRVRIPEKARSAGLKVRIGCHKDTLWHKGEWRRFPEVTIELPLTEAETKVASAFGGPVYVVAPRGCELGAIRVEFLNVVRMPRFVLGSTDVNDWRFSIRNLAAPWAELETRKVILTVPAETIRELDYPDRLMQWWDRVLNAQADLRAISRDRERPERIVADRQISAGYLHAGYPIMGHYHHGAEAVDLPTLETQGNWGFYHELGHNHQHPDWTYDGMGEVTVNLFSLYCYHTINPGVPVHAAVRPDAVAKKIEQFRHDGRKGDAFLELIPYMQMQAAFGWDVYKKVIAEYDALPRDEHPKTDQEKRDQWLIRMSKATDHNLTRFFDFWKIRPSRRARDQVSGLPVWFPEELEHSEAQIDIRKPEVTVSTENGQTQTDQFLSGTAGLRTEISGRIPPVDSAEFNGTMILKIILHRPNRSPLIMTSASCSGTLVPDSGEIEFSVKVNLPKQPGRYQLQISGRKRARLFDADLVLR
jgi:hypothetical protein